MVEDLTARLTDAVHLLRTFPPSTRVRVISHYDADGTAAAGIICHMLQREGYNVFATLMRNPFTKGFDRLMTEEDPVFIFTDMGSGQLDRIEQLKGSSIILDHHQPGTLVPSKKIVQVNSNLCGIDGNYAACGSSLSYLFATLMNPKNADLAWLAIAGAIGDRQHMGGFQAINKDIVQTALKTGQVSEKIHVKLQGRTLRDALYCSIDPYFPGLSGDWEVTDGFLQDLHLKGDVAVNSLDEASLVRLQSALALRLLKAGVAKEVLDLLISPRFYSSQVSTDLESVADILDACGKSGHRGVGFALCLGGRQSWPEAIAIEREYREKILGALRDLPKTMTERKVLRYFISTDSSLGGVIAGIAAMYAVPQDKALFALTRKDNELHISCRGNRGLVEKGLDLGLAMRTIGNELGGHGGGHKIAAGATLAASCEAQFLQKTDELLAEQVKA